MEKEIKLLEKELVELNKFEETFSDADVVTFSQTCSPFLTVICC